MEKSFTPYELIQNTDFIDWVKTGKEGSFSWGEWISSNPDNEKNGKIAKSIILSIESVDEDNPSEKLKSIWDKIDEVIDPS